MPFDNGDRLLSSCGKPACLSRLSKRSSSRFVLEHADGPLIAAPAFVFIRAIRG